MRITTSIASKLLGISVFSLQCGLQANKLPFGTCWKNEGSTTNTYLIYPGVLAEYLGITLDELEERSKSL